jgi:HSP20 family molecular chaperone IbpA
MPRRLTSPGWWRAQQDLDDWFQAGHDPFWVPQAELAETDSEFKIRVNVPGFDARTFGLQPRVKS